MLTVKIDTTILSSIWVQGQERSLETGCKSKDGGGTAG